MKVSSVTGDILGDDLGITLCHEHIHMQFDVCSCPPPKSVKSWPTETDKNVFKLHNLGLIRQYPYSLPYNLKLNDDDSKAVLLDELKRFKDLGGKTIVENTTTGMSPNHNFLKELSVKSGVNIIAGTGYYIYTSQEPDLLNNVKTEMLYKSMLKDLVEGNESGIKCGVIGEIGCSWPIHDFEKKCIEVSAILQEETNKPVTLHPPRDPESPFEILRLFSEAGGNVKKVIMSHLDRTIFDNEKLLEFAALGAYNQFDLFGTECSYYQLHEGTDMNSDAQRIQQINLLKDNGFIDKILMSHDIHTKHRLVNFGGHGYGHILQNIVPKMLLKGFSQDEVDKIIISNPMKWLTSS